MLALSHEDTLNWPLMEFVDGLIVHLWSGVLLVVHAKHNRADAGFQHSPCSERPICWQS